MATRKTAAKKAVTKKAPAKKAAAKKTTKKAPPKKPVLKVGSTVTFVDYADDSPSADDPIFEPNQQLRIVEIEKDEESGEQFYNCVAATDYDAYKEDPESVDGDQLSSTEISTGRAKKEKAPEKEVAVKAIGSLNTILKKHKGDAVIAAQNLYENIQENFFYMGGALAKVFHSGLYLPEEERPEKGFAPKHDREAWNDFCMSNFGFKGRKGTYLVDTYTNLSQISNMNAKRIQAIGWSKASEISRFANEDNIDDLTSDAENMNFKDLKEHLKVEYVDEHGNTPTGKAASRGNTAKKILFRFNLYEDQASTVAEILEGGRTYFGTDDDNAVFEAILNVWASEYLKPKGKSRRKTAAKKK